VTQSRAASLLLVSLIAVSAGAFLRTQQLKLTKSPVARPEVKQSFSPVCTGSPRCHTKALLLLTLREPERITLTIRDHEGNVVRTLVDHERHPKGTVRAVWDGRTTGGSLAHDGTYELAVRLDDHDRTITIPDPIRLDTVPPTVQITRVQKGGAIIRVHFLASEHARTYRLITRQSKVVHEGRTKRPTVTVLRPANLGSGVFTVTIYAEDSAGNRTPSPPSVRITLP
jgi:hypothetical protein